FFRLRGGRQGAFFVWRCLGLLNVFFACAASGRERSVVNAPYNPRTLFSMIKNPERLTVHGSTFGCRHRVGSTEGELSWGLLARARFACSGL
ncbi:MAG: hypothetical protein II767_04765, partial [Proteobacteria bacterium]|nr:hypothetical protein [Pseudomonadota bacterium]